MDKTIEQIREGELAYLRGDISYFIENYCKIEDKDAREAVIPFRLWPEQKRALDSMHRHKFNIILKARAAWDKLACALLCALHADDAGGGDGSGAFQDRA